MSRYVRVPDGAAPGVVVVAPAAADESVDAADDVDASVNTNLGWPAAGSFAAPVVPVAPVVPAVPAVPAAVGAFGGTAAVALAGASFKHPVTVTF